MRRVFLYMNILSGSQPHPLNGSLGDCVFCDIITGKAQGEVHYRDDDLIVIKNRLNWVPVMLLAMPTSHISQDDLWSSPMFSKLTKVALEMGHKFCPNGFRLLSNFGSDGLQSQSHGHLHVLGGMQLGLYV
jgi:histidine triad (HIT) family protein